MLGILIDKSTITSASTEKKVSSKVKNYANLRKLYLISDRRSLKMQLNIYLSWPSGKIVFKNALQN